MKTITYYSGDEFHEDKYEFEVSLEDLQNALYEMFSDVYGIPLESAKSIVDEFDLYDQLEECFEDEIKEYFEESSAQSLTITCRLITVEGHSLDFQIVVNKSAT